MARLSPVPLSQSPLFQLQKAFYEEGGLSSWQQNIVPSFITSNAFIAERYASVIITAWQEAGVTDDGDGLLPILELGAGSGKLAFGVLRNLLPRAAAVFGPGVVRRILYCMSDAAASVVRGWDAQPQLRRLKEASLMEFVCLDVSDESAAEWGRTGIPLPCSGGFLGGQGSAAWSAPLVVVANYVADSLPCDVFRVTQTEQEVGPEEGEDGLSAGKRVLQRAELRELLVTSSSSPAVEQPPPAHSAKRQIKEFAPQWCLGDEPIASMERALRFDEATGERTLLSVPASGKGGGSDDGDNNAPQCCQHVARVGLYTQRLMRTSKAEANEDDWVMAAAALALDRCLDWYLSHACDKDAHQAFKHKEGMMCTPPAGVGPQGEGEADEKVEDGGVDTASKCDRERALAGLLSDFTTGSGAQTVSTLLAHHDDMFRCQEPGGGRLEATAPSPTSPVPASAPGLGIAPPAAAGSSSTSSTFTVPLGTALCLARLHQVSASHGGFTLLCADKGLLNPWSSVGSSGGAGGAASAMSGPDIHKHGSFSTMLNFHFLGLWSDLFARALGDHGLGPSSTQAASPSINTVCLVSPDDDVNLKSMLLLFRPSPSIRGPKPRLHTVSGLVDAWYQGLCAFGPGDLFDLFHALTRETPSRLNAYGYSEADKKYVRRRRKAKSNRIMEPARAKRIEPPAKEASSPSDDLMCSDTDRSSSSGDSASSCSSPSSSSDDDGSTSEDELAASTMVAGPSAALSSGCATHADAAVTDGSDEDDQQYFDYQEHHDKLAEAEVEAENSSKRPRGSRRKREALGQHRFLSLRAAVALCRLCRWDQDVVHSFRKTFAARLERLTPPRRWSILEGFKASWNGFFLPAVINSAASESVGSGGAGVATASEYALPFTLGRILFLNGSHLESQSWFLAFLRHVQPGDPTTLFNLGLCCRMLGQKALARMWFQQASSTGHQASKVALAEMGGCAEEENGSDDDDSDGHDCDCK